jgi:hypothetical protein
VRAEPSGDRARRASWCSNPIEEDSVKIVNRMIAGLGICAALAGAATAAPSDGPFTTVQDVVAYWIGQPTSGAATQIFVDGFKVYERSGFGPAFVQQYFGCGEYGIRTHCTNDPFAGFVTAAEPASQFGAGKTIYLDGKLYKSGSPYYQLYLKTCRGEASFYGKVKYFVVEAINDGFGPPFPGNDCFQ